MRTSNFGGYMDTFVLVLLLVILLYFLIKQHRKAKYNKSIMENQKQQIDSANSCIYSQTQDLQSKDREILSLSNEFSKYKADVKNNYRELLPYGERILIDYFCTLLSAPGFENWNIYGHLNLKYSVSKNYQADFLIVSDRGIYVVESKFWKGLTLIYTDGHPMIFSDTMYSDYGKGSDKGITIFNISKDRDTEKLEINKYNNPVAQARQYSKVLRNYLGRHVHNIVVFQEDENCQIKINDKDFDCYRVDQYTRITTQNNLISILKNSCMFQGVDLDKINDTIRNKFEYSICLNSSNINQPP